MNTVMKAALAATTLIGLSGCPTAKGMDFDGFSTGGSPRSSRSWEDGEREYAREESWRREDRHSHRLDWDSTIPEWSGVGRHR